MNKIPEQWIRVPWPAPPQVQAWSTTRQGGVSCAPYASMNLGDHVGDRIEDVLHNRQILQDSLRMPASPDWLQQVHGAKVVELDNLNQHGMIEADASICHSTKHVCAVMTADCLPVLFCDTKGTCVAAAHAGWRGLCAGVLEATVSRMNIPGNEILAWLGPAIGPQRFEVGPEVRDAYLAVDVGDVSGFTAAENGRWRADLYQLARNRLQRVGVQQIYGGGYCTYDDVGRFYSYRRDQQTGRMASLVWINE